MTEELSTVDYVREEYVKRPHRRIKAVIAPTLDYLELRVNAFLELPANDHFDFHGTPVKFQHDEYTQFFIEEVYY